MENSVSGVAPGIFRRGAGSFDGRAKLRLAECWNS